MFKLIKILNSGTNQPEPCRVPAAAGTPYKRATLALIKNGLLMPALATDIPTFIVGEDLECDEKLTVLAFPINENMIFETEISDSPSQLAVGDKVTLAVSEGHAVGVTADTTSGVCEIFNLAGAVEAGDKVQVRIV